MNLLFPILHYHRCTTIKMNVGILNKLLPLIFAVMPIFNLSAKCILPQESDFDKFYFNLLEQKGWQKKSERNTIRLEDYRYKSEMDSLFQYAMAYFHDRLPINQICAQVDVIDSAWLSFHNMSVKMGFSYYLSKNNSGKYDERIDVHFSYHIKEKKISYYLSPNKVWIPNCKLYPDSCNFKITSIKECKEIAKKVGFIKNDQLVSSYLGRQIPFHYNVTKMIDDDCCTQSLYINMYTGDTSLSSRNIAYGCQTWKNKIDGSSIVVDGTVVEEEGFALDGSIYTKAKIEIHHLFKGSENSNYIYAVVLGGTIGHTSTSLSHGQINLGKKNDRRIYFLSRDLKYKDKILPIEELLGHKIHFTNHDPYSPRKVYASRAFPKKSYEEQFQRIEKIVGHKREVKLYPKTWDENILGKRNTVPDRQKGLAINLKEDYRESFQDSICLYFSMASTNDILYLKEWDFELKYDTLAFGSWVFEKNKIELMKSYQAYKKLVKYYNLEINDKDANTVYFKWTAKDSSKLFFEFFPIQDQIPKMQFLSAIKLSVKDVTIPMNLTLALAKNPVGYNHSSSSEYLIKHHEKSNTIYQSLSYHKTPILDNFFPRSAITGDTIVITGQYLENTSPLIFGIGPTEKDKFVAVKKKDIVSQTDTTITFVIPTYLIDKPQNKTQNQDTEVFKPSTNVIRLKKKSAYKGAASKEKLIIN